jgi:hypothetical protein
MMRVLLDGVVLETARYAENGDIHFTTFTDGDEFFVALSTLLDSSDKVLALQRGGESLSVRVLEHQVWPPFSHRCDGIVHRHDVHLVPTRGANAPA